MPKTRSETKFTQSVDYIFTDLVRDEMPTTRSETKFGDSDPKAKTGGISLFTLGSNYIREAKRKQDEKR